jgi:hypothetical protein
MSYLYTAENRLMFPHSYMYASYEGQVFLAAYVADRRRRLTLHLQGAICPIRGSLNNALSSAAQSRCEATSPDAFLPTERTLLQPLLASLLGVLAVGNAMAARPWLDRVIQRFEVSKKLYAVYSPGFRKGEGDAHDPSRYAELALCLALGYALTGHLQYLSTLLKLMDLLLSIPAVALSRACSPEQLTLLVEVELDAVSTLARAQGVIIEAL